MATIQGQMIQRARGEEVAVYPLFDEAGYSPTSA